MGSPHPSRLDRKQYIAFSSRRELSFFTHALVPGPPLPPPFSCLVHFYRSLSPWKGQGGREWHVSATRAGKALDMPSLGPKRLCPLRLPQRAGFIFFFPQLRQEGRGDAYPWGLWEPAANSPLFHSKQRKSTQC